MAGEFRDTDDALSEENFDVVGQTMDGQNGSEEFVDDFDDAWHAELEDALLEGFVDHAVIRNICKCRILPVSHRPEVWKICLKVASRGNALSCWDGKLDLSEQSEIHDACQTVVTDMELENPEQALLDLESVITFYCKSRALKYNSDCAWTDILRPIADLQEYSRADIYNCFYAVSHRYIPREKYPNAPYNLFRLVLLYHDPELCSFLDSKKVAMQSFMKPWLRSLFASRCKRGVTQVLWDIYLQRADPFFMFFLSLVILVNAKEQIISTMGGKDKIEIIEALTDFPSALETVDVEDFCQLALHFADKTPKSVHKIYQDVLFGGPVMLTLSKEFETAEKELAQSLCLQVALSDILLPRSGTFDDEQSQESDVRFFLVDCRSPDLYNAGHLNTAFHLDATLMLREPNEFSTAVEALSKAQEQAIHAGSAAGGEHLCLIGSGIEEDDQYMYMVIAHLLKNHRSHVSIVRGGFKAVLNYLSDANINLSEWITGTSDPKQLLRSVGCEKISITEEKKNITTTTKISEPRTMESFMKSFTTSLKTTSQNFKEKVSKLIENPDQDDLSHVGVSHKGKAYRGTQPVFSIGDEDDNSMDENRTKAFRKGMTTEDSDVDEEQLVNLEKWMKKRTVKSAFPCFLVPSDGRRLNAHLLVVGDDLFCLREYQDSGKSRVVSTRPLSTITKITSKRTCPELITFRFKFLSSEGASNDDPANETVDRYLIPEAGLATMYIKQQIMRVLDAVDAN